MFGAQVGRSPDSVALTYESESLTYREFAARVHRLARFLVSRGVGPESLVGVGMGRSIELMVGIYAVMVAGGAYVPLDPGHPEERNTHILRDRTTGVRADHPA